MMAWLEGEIQTHTIPIHYYRTRGEKPALVLLHGLSDSGLCWTPVAEELQAEYDVIMLDARGHGHSGRSEGAIPLETLAADVAASMKALGVEKAYLQGHSMGAGTAAFVAARYPDLVQALVLEDPPWAPRKPSEDREAPGIRSWPQWILPLRGLSTKERLVQAHKSNPTWLEAELAPWAEAKEQLDMSIFDVGIDTSHPHWSEFIAQIHCPILLITGDSERGAIVTQETAQLVERAIPGIQVVHIQDAGHNIRREQHGAYMTAVQAFLRAQQAQS
jgi:pimeloyl-ACP methyl ester carboxylesterase